MKAIKLIAGLALLLLFTTNLSAQYRYKYFRVGISAGASNYLGDLDDDQPWLFTKPGFGVNVLYKINPLMAWRLSYYRGWLEGSDENSTNVPRLRRNLHFRSNVQEFSMQLVIDFVPSTRRYQFRPNVTPYVFGGIAVFSFNPQALLNDRWEDLQPLGTEGQLLPDRESRNYPEAYGLAQYAIPMGVGLKFAVSRRLDLEFETGVRKTFTDYIDDVSGFYPDQNALRDHNPKAFILSDRIDRDLYPAGAEAINGIRGDNTQDDWYIYTNISLNLILDFNRCPTF